MLQSNLVASRSDVTYPIRKKFDWLLPGFNRWCFHFELFAVEQKKKELGKSGCFSHITDTSCGLDEEDV